MVKIAYPEPDFQMKEEDGKEVIFDRFRRSWVRLTPEEWVRQNFLVFLVKVMQYPSSLIAVETEIRLHELRKRCDIVVYKNDQPWMIIECKEMNEPMSEAVLMQVLRYNISIPSPYLVITNGIHCFAWQLLAGKAIELNELPAW